MRSAVSALVLSLALGHAVQAQTPAVPAAARADPANWPIASSPESQGRQARLRLPARSHMPGLSALLLTAEKRKLPSPSLSKTQAMAA